MIFYYRRMMYHTMEKAYCLGVHIVVPPNRHNNEIEELPKDLSHYIRLMGIKQEDMIAECQMNRKTCKWKSILTPDGLCYTINMYDASDIFKENM